ncbi:MAG TPA: type II toxin-antitoxin system VapC family toxin [Acetobacteraceae bacterium]|nr:type II toxin-antitoxin system VapC family toxin [Acetobacteraceae bacterium]
MILIDTSVWVDHLRRGDLALSDLLTRSQVLTHPFVIGELALGSLRQRDIVLGALRDLPQAVVAGDDEVQAFIDRHTLFGIGIGYVDAHLLAGTLLTSGARLWSRDKRLSDAAGRLGIAADRDH